MRRSDSGGGLWGDDTPEELPIVEKPRRPLGRTRRASASQPLITEPEEITFTELRRCASCGRLAPYGPPPMPHKVGAWTVLAFDHEPDCRWIATRGYSLKE